MPDFIVTAPDGTQHKITARDKAEATFKARAMLKAQMRAAPPAAAPPAPGFGPQTTGFQLPQRAAPAPAPEDAFKRTGLGAAEGVSSSTPGTMEDALMSAKAGLGRGGYGLIGMPGDIERLGRMGLNWAGGEGTVEEDSYIPGSEELMGRGGFQDYDPQTTLGKYIKSGAEFIPAAAAFGVTGGARAALSSALKYGAVPGVASEGAGQAAQAFLPGNDMAEMGARVGGALLAPAALATGRRLITPSPSLAGSLPKRNQAREILRQNGVTTITGGQRSGSKFTRLMESELAPGRAQQLMEEQLGQFTRAALSRAGVTQASMARYGVDGTRATQDTIDAAYRMLGDRFNRLAANHTLRADLRFGRGIGDAVRRYETLTGQPAPLARAYRDEIVQVLRTGRMIPGDIYQSLRSRLSADVRATASDPYLNEALRRMLNTLDDAMGRSIPEAARAEWRRTRRQYRNLITLSKAVESGGEEVSLGLISPQKLATATKIKQGARNYVRGRGDLSQLADAGKTLLSPLPNSNTAARQRVQQLGASTLGAAAGAGAGSQFIDNSSGAYAGALAGAFLPYGAGRYMLSRMGRAHTGNQLLRSRPWRPFAQGGAAAAGLLPQLAAPQ